MSPRKPSDPLLKAGDIRLGTDALYRGTAPAGDYMSLQDDSLLVMPPLSEQDQAVVDSGASRHVARHTMLAGHGCTGTACRSGQHGAGRDQMHLALIALGLMEDPLSASRTDHWGRRVRPEAGPLAEAGGS